MKKELPGIKMPSYRKRRPGKQKSKKLPAGVDATSPWLSEKCRGFFIWPSGYNHYLCLPGKKDRAKFLKVIIFKLHFRQIFFII